CSSNAAAPSALHTLSLHDALPIFGGAAGHHRLGPAAHRGDLPARLHRAATDPRGLARRGCRELRRAVGGPASPPRTGPDRPTARDRKSTRLNSSHVKISYAVFCLK